MKISPLRRPLLPFLPFLVVSLLLPAKLHKVLAQQPAATGIAAEERSSPNLAGIAHIALRVRDLADAVAFYEKLGFVKAFELSREGHVYEAFIKINDRQFIELYPATAEAPQIGFLHVCFEGAALQSVHDFYIAEGLHPTDVRTAGAGNLLFTMRGPLTPTGEQNLEYTQYMPGSLHSKDFGQHLGANRISTKITSVAIATADPETSRKFYLEKMGFLPAAQGRLAIPGTASGTEFIAIAPAQALGFRSRLTLQVRDLAMAIKALQQLSIPYAKGVNSVTLTDPDGNEIVLAPLASSSSL